MRASEPAAARPRATLARLVGRATLLRCPRCGARGVWRSWFRMRHACPACGLAFERGEAADFWIGAYLINLVVAEVSAVLIAGALWFTFGARVSFNTMWAASIALAIVMPMVFFPFSRTLWLAFDLHFRPAEAGDAG
jgi:uncharacterized protein (DUF983 family)